MDWQSFAALVMPFKDKMYRLAFSVTGDTGLAEDVLQDVFIKLWDQREQLKTIDNLGAWCMRMTRNQAIDKTRSRHFKVSAIPEGFDKKDPEADPAQLTEQADTLAHLQSWMRQLPPAQREVIQLRDVEGFTYEEIGATLQLSASQVKVYLHRARLFLREKVQHLMTSKTGATRNRT